MQKVDFYTAHECLLLQYEEAMTRIDSTSGNYYDTSAHLLWVGERTRQPGFAHFEFVRGLENPLGVKISDKASPEDVLEILDTFNPENIPGRVTLITRMTASGIREKLPAIIKAVQAAEKHVVWVSDPVHGNGFQAENGFKTRSFDAIRDELVAFFDVHRECGSHPGGRRRRRAVVRRSGLVWARRRAASQFFFATGATSAPAEEEPRTPYVESKFQPPRVEEVDIHMAVCIDSVLVAAQVPGHHLWGLELWQLFEMMGTTICRWNEFKLKNHFKYDSN